MKNVFSIFLIVINFWHSESQIINFNDANLKSYLLQSNTLNYIAQNNLNNNIIIDTNNNGEIEQSEALEVYFLYLINININNLTGIEYFTNLKWLAVGNNNLTTIDLSQLTNLETLGCQDNQLSNIDFTGLLNLKRVLLQNNLFTSLDFSGNPVFNELQCSSNLNLTTLKINNNYQQTFIPTYSFDPINWTNLPNLTTICADSFEVADLQSFLVSCGITQPITINTSCTLDNDVFETANFSIYPNPSNGLFTVDFGNSIETANLMIYNILGQEVYSENIKNATNKTLNLEHLSKGTFVLKISDGEETITKNLVIQ